MDFDVCCSCTSSTLNVLHRSVPSPSTSRLPHSVGLVSSSQTVAGVLLAPAFLQQPHAFPSEHGGAKAVCLGNTPAQGVVLVAEDLALGLAVFACAHYRHVGQLVLVVVAVVLFGVAAYAFSQTNHILPLFYLH